MSPANDERYLRYVIARFGAYRNVWWSMANEYDFLRTKKEADWDRICHVVQQYDPYGHLRSIHNGAMIYNDTQPWVSHASIQNGAAVEDPDRAVLYRDVYRKPIVFDEVKYEGDVAARWGQLSAQELVLRFWSGVVAGTYVGHSEIFAHSDSSWLAIGGVLTGQSPPRLAFLRKVMEDAPDGEIDPIDKWQDERTGGKAGQYYLIYFGKEAPASWDFSLYKAGLKDGDRFSVEILDTWNMTITPVPGVFTTKKRDNYVFMDAGGAPSCCPPPPISRCASAVCHEIRPPPSSSRVCRDRGRQAQTAGANLWILTAADAAPRVGYGTSRLAEVLQTDANLHSVIMSHEGARRRAARSSSAGSATRGSGRISTRRRRPPARRDSSWRRTRLEPWSWPEPMTPGRSMAVSNWRAASAPRGRSRRRWATARPRSSACADPASGCRRPRSCPATASTSTPIPPSSFPSFTTSPSGRATSISSRRTG